MQFPNILHNSLQKYHNLTNVIFNDDNIDMKFLCTVYKNQSNIL